ncbi:MAG TPA: NAD(P)/FAD-dependent oxidoreductase [Xanthobacteraceae bacterium]
MAGISRRKVIGGAAAGLLPAGGLGRAAQAQDAAAASITAEVCVVGAGFAGLAAAYRLKQAGADVVVLEARNRVGGRSLTIKTEDGAWIDLGAHWVGPTQDRFMAMIKEMGCETYRSPRLGKVLQLGIFDQSKYQRIGAADQDRDPGARLTNAEFDRLDRLAAKLDPEKPWSFPDAERLDATTFSEWARQNIRNANARRFVTEEMCAIACASPEELSILHMLFLIKACGGVEKLIGYDGDAQQDCVIGGTQLVAQRLAEKLAGAIRHGAPVRRLEWSANGAVVHADTVSVAARHVILAVPPHFAGAIEYAPALPVDRVQVTQRWPQGLVIKVQIVYREPFWRRDGLSGESFDYESVLGETDDSSVPERYSGTGILTGFVYAAHARKLAPLPAEDRKQQLLAEVAKRFGRAALDPIGYYEANWSQEQWTRGCFTGFLTPGATVLFRSAVRDPVGPLHFAGSETATVWPSFIDGAIRSGERAAAAVGKA